MNKTEIGAFQAKARLSAILHEVEKGNSFTITIRGRPVADLIPTQLLNESNIGDAINNMINIKKIRGIDDKTIHLWITEGRK